MPIAEITRTESAERARLLRVDTYHVSLDLTQGERTFGSTSVIRFSCAEPGAGTYADLVADAVHEITLNGLAAQNELRVTASCAYSTDGGGLGRYVDSADGRVYTYSNCEPADARRVFADFEQPDLKAVFHLEITAPAHWTVLANTPAPQPAPGADASAVWTFPPTERLSTYLICLCAGEYVVVHGSHTTGRGQLIPLELAARASLAEYLEPQEMFEVTGQASTRSCSTATSRTRSTARSSCPNSGPGRWRTRAWSPSASSCCTARRSPTRATSCGPWSCCTRWRTCGSATT
jgi:aminopeptidase N